MTATIHLQDALEAVRSALAKRWPECTVHLFGSTANQLSICNNNDIDVCLELPGLPTDAVRAPSSQLLPGHAWDLWMLDPAQPPGCPTRISHMLSGSVSLELEWLCKGCSIAPDLSLSMR